VRGDVTVVDLTSRSGVDAGHRAATNLRRVARRHHRRHLEYDEKGPAWYWNTLRFGRAHPDALRRAISLGDRAGSEENACDTIPARRFVGPASVIDIRRMWRRPDFLATTSGSNRGSASTAGFRGCVGAAAYRLEPAHRRRVHQRRPRRPAQPGFDREASRMLAPNRDVSGVGVETIGTDAGQAGTSIRRSPTHHHARRRQVRLASLCNLDQLPPTGAVVIAAPLKIVHGSGSLAARSRASIPGWNDDSNAEPAEHDEQAYTLLFAIRTRSQEDL
jgi:kynurenine formamidase